VGREVAKDDRSRGFSSPLTDKPTINGGPSSLSRPIKSGREKRDQPRSSRGSKRGKGEGHHVTEGNFCLDLMSDGCRQVNHRVDQV